MAAAVLVVMVAGGSVGVMATVANLVVPMAAKRLALGRVTGRTAAKMDMRRVEAMLVAEPQVEEKVAGKMVAAKEAGSAGAPKVKVEAEAETKEGAAAATVEAVVEATVVAAVAAETAAIATVAVAVMTAVATVAATVATEVSAMVVAMGVVTVAVLMGEERAAKVMVAVTVEPAMPVPVAVTGWVEVLREEATSAGMAMVVGMAAAAMVEVADMTAGTKAAAAAAVVGTLVMVAAMVVVVAPVVVAKLAV